MHGGWQFAPNTTFVSDSWGGTIAAVNQYMRDRGYTNRDFKHELVNRNQGEVVNPRGFTTNHIENRWSVFKRWARYHNGGKLPHHGDRHRWTLLVDEFRFRKLIHAQKGYPRIDSDIRVTFGEMLAVLKDAV